jgi:predicted dehydrogenase
MNSGDLGKTLFLDISAGMNISGQGTHTLNYGRSLIGDPKVVRVFGQISGWDSEDSGHPAPLCSEALLDFDNGCRGLWTSGPVSPRCGDPETTWQHVRVAAYAEKGRVNYEEFANWQVVCGSESEEGNFGGMDEWSQKNVEAQGGLSRAMFEWLEGGAPVGTNLKTSLHEWAVILALYQSSIEHRPIELDGYEPDPDLMNKFAESIGS